MALKNFAYFFSTAFLRRAIHLFVPFPFFEPRCGSGGQGLAGGGMGWLGRRARSHCEDPGATEGTGPREKEVRR
jgi:hypothetical protein